MNVRKMIALVVLAVLVSMSTVGWAIIGKDVKSLDYDKGSVEKSIQIVNSSGLPHEFATIADGNEVLQVTSTSLETSEYSPDEVVFKLVDTDGDSSIQAEKSRQLVQKIADKHKFVRTDHVFKKKEKSRLNQIYVSRLSAGESPVEVCKKLKDDPSVEWAELNYYYHCQMTPNDTYYNSTGSWGQAYGDMWGLHAINPENAWDQSQGEGVIVAVIDTGVDYNHEDLYLDSDDDGQLDVGEQYNVWINPGEDVNSNGFVDPGDFDGLDNDDNGFIDDIRGWNFVSGNNNPADDYGHGTHCAGIIAAVGNNSKGIIGAAPRAKIMIVKGLNSSGSGTMTALANCITYAADKGANILSNSWGGGGESQAITAAIEYARDRNCVVVAAAGNSSLNAALFFPANIQDILTVAALDPSLNLASFSNYGSVVDFSAPGVGILSLRAAGTDIYGNGTHFVPLGDPNAKYYQADGTSMACPFVSGLAALVLAQDPYLSETAVRRVIAASAGTLGISNVYVGTGIADAEAALGAIDEVSGVDANIVRPEYDLDPFSTVQPLDVNGTADGDSYVLEYGEGYYPSAWTTISTGTSVINGLLGTLDLSDKEGPYHIRLTVNEGTKTAVEHTIFSADPNLHPGWPVHLGGDVFNFGGYILGGAYTSTPFDADHDGNDEIFVGSGGHTFGLKGDGTILPGWPTTQVQYPAYATNASMPGPSAADVNNDGNTEILWTLREYNQFKCFNGKNLDGSNMSGFPQQAIEELSNAFNMPFVLADLDNNGTLEAVTSHTKGNNGKYYRLSAYNYQGTRLFTHDLEDVNESFIALSFGDLDGDGQKDIVGISRDNYPRQNCTVYLHSFDVYGNEQSGYPVFLYNVGSQGPTERIYAPPFLADVDNDGDLEVIIVFDGGNAPGIHCYHHDGTSVSGFPVHVDNNPLVSLQNYSMGDADGDGEAEIVVLGRSPSIPRLSVYLVDLDGTVQLVWSRPGVDDIFRVPPAIVDVDNDGQQDICFTTFSGCVYACSSDGRLITGFPKKMSFLSTSGVSVGDVDGDGLFELITATLNGTVYVWDTPTPAVCVNSDWPMRHVNPRNTNVFARPNVHNITSNMRYENIQDAIDEASNEDEIVVYPGTYYEGVDFNGLAVTLRSTAPDDWNIVEATVIDCQGSRQSPKCGAVFNNGENGNSILEGFTISNGYGQLHYDAYSGGAIYCEGSSPTIRRCILKNNTNDAVNEDTGGGAISCYFGANPLIEECFISENEAYGSAGICIWYSSPTIRNCVISDNHAYESGGIGIYDSNNVNISNCTVVNNSAYAGGGISSYESTQTIINCILWGNGDDLYGYPYDCSATYSCIEDGDSGTGNISSDPCFVDANDGYFYLDVNSPCIDKGDPSRWIYAGQKDIAGEPRGQGKYVDMGADEVAVTSTGGAGIECINSSPEIAWCIISDNSYSGVTCLGSSTPTITNNIIENNGSDGISASVSVPTVQNNLIYNNNFLGIRFNDSNSTSIVSNNTIVGNSYCGVGYYGSGGYSPAISNCILWNNGDDLDDCSALYSCIQDGDSGTGNIDDDPFFVNADANDFHLEPNSPCIDVGNPNGNYIGQKDIDRDNRVIDISGKGDDVNDVDIGADEYSND